MLPVDVAIFESLFSWLRVRVAKLTVTTVFGVVLSIVPPSILYDDACVFDVMSTVDMS